MWTDLVRGKRSTRIVVTCVSIVVAMNSQSPGRPTARRWLQASPTTVVCVVSLTYDSVRKLVLTARTLANSLAPWSPIWLCDKLLLISRARNTNSKCQHLCRAHQQAAPRWDRIHPTTPATFQRNSNVAMLLFNHTIHYQPELNQVSRRCTHTLGWFPSS
jgi:hypothetical protein